jgi:hypothetical protein
LFMKQLLPTLDLHILVYEVLTGGYGRLCSPAKVSIQDGLSLRGTEGRRAAMVSAGGGRCPGAVGSRLCAGGKQRGDRQARAVLENASKQPEPAAAGKSRAVTTSQL